ncbi:hypothetical protein BDQ17DRAFT_1389036 [Cyathus striatus]|nr:hypothetical protein BDQ17DRAFT_1389036 [Cyathus striatus]
MSSFDSSLVTTILNHLTALLRLDAYSERTRKLIASGGVVAALLIVFRYALRRGRPVYVSDLGKVGRIVGGGVVKDEAKGEWDYIIVGGGTAGCALAARLSEDPNVKVLVLESGGSGRALSFTRIPSSFAKLFRVKKYVHGLYTEPQTALAGKRKFWPRARMLGGCSSINAQMAQYGAPGDFDEWATFTGDKSYSYANFRKYFTKFEQYQPHPDYPKVERELRGNSGPMKIGYFNNITESSKDFIKSCVSVGIPFNADFWGRAGTMGVSRIMTYIDSKYTHVLARKNLTVVIHATVTRILFDEVKSSEPRAIGVEFGNTEGGPRYQVKAKREVIVSGGAVHSPHILMLSGIGPGAHLKEHGITVVKDLPVGQNLVDHPVVDLYFKTKLDNSLKYLQPRSISDVYKLFSALYVYYILGKGGPLATNFGEAAAFIRSDDPKLLPEYQDEVLPDSTSGKESPDLELFTTPLAYKDHGKTFFDIHSYGLHAYLLRPTSHGAVLLKSPNPWVQPSVNPNYLQTPEDTARLVRSIRVLLKIAHTTPLSEILDPNAVRDDLDHQLHLKSDEEMAKIVHERAETIYHPTTSCRMGPREKGCVVDSKMRVYGVRGLRVCDASIFPYIISGHTAGACIAVAEKLADDIKAEIASLCNIIGFHCDPIRLKVYRLSLATPRCNSRWQKLR